MRRFFALLAGLLCLASPAWAQTVPSVRVLLVDANGAVIAPALEGGNLAAIAASLAVMDDWDESDRAKVNLIVGQAGVAGGSGTVSAATQRVVLATDVALPAGTNSIGIVDSELPAAAAMTSDNVASPTAPAVASFPMVWDGSTWDRWTGAVSGTVTANAGTDLNTSALLTTAVHDAAFGTAGTADAQVRTIQGIASMTPVLIGLPDEGQQTMANSISVAIASNQSAVTVDTELPAAVALSADNVASPTVPGVGAFLMCWDGATWDRCSASGGVQYTEADTDATVTGTAVMWKDAANTLVAASTAKALPVSFYTSAGAEVTPSAVDTEDDAVAAGQSSVALAVALAYVHDGTDWSRAATGAGTANSQTLRVAADTELPTAAALATDMANPTVPAVGAFAMIFDGTTWDRWTGTVQPGNTANTTPWLVSLAEGGATVQVTATGGGSLQVECASGCAGSGGTASVDDADFTAATTSGTPVMGVFESSPTSVTDGDLGIVGITAARRLKTSATLDAALPAGTNNIGDVDVLTLPALPAGDNNIGNVDIVTLPDEGQQTMASSISVAIASNQSAVSVTAAGAAAHDAAVSGNPLLLGAESKDQDGAALPNSVTAEGEAVRLASSLSGVLYVMPVSEDGSTIAALNVGQINGVTPLMGNGVTGTGSQRVTIASDNTAFTVNVGTFPDNEPFNVAQINGVTPLMGNGVTGTGSQRVTIASDNTAFTVNVGTFPDNEPINVAQVNGVTVLMGAGNTGTGSQRVTEATDSQLSAGVGATGDAAATAGSTGSLTAKARLMTTQLDAIQTAVQLIDNDQTGASVHYRTSTGAAGEDEHEIKATAGRLFSVTATNTNAAARYLRCYNLTAANTTPGTSTVFFGAAIPGNTAGAGFTLNFGPKGIAFGTALTCTLTTGVADTDVAEVAANEIKLVYSFD